MLSRFESLLVGREDATGVLLDALPTAKRALVEVAFVLSLLFGVRLLQPLTAGALTFSVSLLAIVFVGWGYVLFRPERSLSQGRTALAVASSAALFVLVPAVVAIQLVPEGLSRPRLGLELENVAAAQAGEAAAEQHARVVGIVPGSASDGTVRVGDVILSADGVPLSATRPAADLAARSRDPAALPGPEIALEVLRDGATTTLQLDVGTPPTAEGLELRGRGFFYWLSARNLSLLALVVLLVVRDGQRFAQLGLRANGFRLELKRAVAVLAGAYLVHIAVSVPLGLLSFATGFGREDAVQRSGFLAQLGEGVGFLDLAVFLMMAAAFEEIVFRGFLLPRLFSVTRRWSVSVLLAAVVFGVAHIDQGILAVFQTGVLGIYFAAAFLRRARTEAVIVAHAAFNLMMFGALYWLVESGWLERAQELLPN